MAIITSRCRSWYNHAEEHVESVKATCEGPELSDEVMALVKCREYQYDSEAKTLTYRYVTSRKKYGKKQQVYTADNLAKLWVHSAYPHRNEAYEAFFTEVIPNGKYIWAKLCKCRDDDKYINTDAGILAAPDVESLINIYTSAGDRRISGCQSWDASAVTLLNRTGGRCTIKYWLKQTPQWRRKAISVIHKRMMSGLPCEDMFPQKEFWDVPYTQEVYLVERLRRLALTWNNTRFRKYDEIPNPYNISLRDAQRICGNYQATERQSAWEHFSTWLDYLREKERQGVDINDPYWRYHKKWEKMHRRAMQVYHRRSSWLQRLLRQRKDHMDAVAYFKNEMQEYKKRKDNVLEENGYRAYVSSEYNTWKKQAVTLHQCILRCSYYEKKTSLLVFVSKNGKPNSTFEVSLKTKKVIQKYADEQDRSSCKPDDNANALVDRYIKQFVR